jgi:dihydrolipoamide dehydrogenase
MKRASVDVAVIGTGTAGLAAYRAARAAGRTAALIEGGPYGTTCARVGCMPSKLLIAAAEAAHGVSRFDEFGLRLNGRLEVDGRAVMARVRRERDRFVGFVLRGIDEIPDADRIRGYAAFVDDHTLQIDDGSRIVFRSAVIATGSSPVVPPMLKPLGDRLVVNDDIFEWQTLPHRVAVFGPGVIGLELGQALARLGVEVLMFGRGGSVGSFTDPSLRDYAVRTFGDEFYLDPDADVESVARIEDGVRLSYRTRQGERIETVVDFAIAATGRAPNVHRLGIGNTSLARDETGIPRFDRTTLQCGAGSIFIAGDVNNDVPLLHEAADEGRIAGENAARFPVVQAGTRRSPLAIVFTDPQIALVGARFGDLRANRFVTGSVSFEDQGRARTMLRNKGLLHVYADSTSGRFLGAEMIGPDAEHMGHLLAWALPCGLTIDRMLELPFYHPVVEEGLRTALRDARAQLQRPVATKIRAVG